MKKLIALILILVVSSIVVTRKKPPKLTLQPDGTYFSNQITDSNWEYVKERLFSGKGETEFFYKMNQLEKNAPILINLQGATGQDSIAVNEIISRLKTIIPNKTINYFKDFTGITYLDFSLSDPSDSYKMIKGVSHFKLIYSTIHLNFGKENDEKFFDDAFDDVIATVLPDGSSIQRTNPPREEIFPTFPSKVWFHLKDTLPISKRKKYIQYELFRTLCFLYPNNSKSRNLNIQKGVFFTPNYIPEEAKFNDKDKFLLQKLYEEDFIDQFKDYLYTHYSWRYAINFLNKNYSKTIAWAVIICIALFAATLLLGFFQKRKFKYAYLNYFLPIYFIMLYLINSIFIYKYLTDVRETLEFKQHILTGFLTATVLALLASLFLWITDKYWVNKISNFSFQLIVKIFSTFFIFNIPGIIILILFGDSSGFLEFYLPMFIFTIVLAIGRGILIYLNHYSENLVKQKDLELSRLKQVNAQAEVKLLQSQINPHFLYNALNSIASLAYVSAEKTEKMALSLSDLFKYAINRTGKKTSTVKNEVEMVQNYLEIEQTRFGDRLEFVINVEDEVLHQEIPMFILQPLVENAVKHGIAKIEGKGKIVLQILKTNNGIEIKVLDNGPDFPEGLVSGHGLQTVFDLLRLSYGDKALLKWQNTPKKSIIIVIDKTP